MCVVPESLWYAVTALCVLWRVVVVVVVVVVARHSSFVLGPLPLTLTLPLTALDATLHCPGTRPRSPPASQGTAQHSAAPAPA